MKIKKLIMVIMVFVAAASGMSEATGPVVSSYKDIFNSDDAYIAVILGDILRIIVSKLGV